jgi:single-stranded-DNA-specific exonuclease
MDELLTLEAIDAQLRARFKEGFPTLKDLPSPFSFKDMDKAASRIVDAIRRKERIAVVGDYDVDGVTATTLMIEFFSYIDYPVQWVIPNRFKDGYGLSVGVIDKLDYPDLIVTVDNGIAAVEAAQACKMRGIELIITDHHLLPPELPEAYAIIDQKRPDCTFPYDEVCGAQIAWYLIAALKNKLGLSLDLKAMLDLTATAIIADMMPLRHINRAMVIAGLQMAARSKRPAMRAFLEYLDKSEVTAEDIGFGLAPLLNSAGRMEDAGYAVDFLLSRNIYDARAALAKLVAFNEERKRIENDLTRSALKQAYEQNGVVVAYGQDWHEGVVGIVAARVARACKRPALILSRNEEGRLKGSGRSFHGCDLFGLLSSSRSMLETFGGHRAAVGLSLHEEHLERFCSTIDEAYASLRIDTRDPDILGRLSFALIGFDLITLLKRYEPYGTGNPKPKFVTTVRVVSSECVGKDGNHVRYRLEEGGIVREAMHFKCDAALPQGSTAEIVYTVAENRFRDTVRVQLYIEEINPLAR